MNDPRMSTIQTDSMADARSYGAVSARGTGNVYVLFRIDGLVLHGDFGWRPNMIWSYGAREWNDPFFKSDAWRLGNGQIIEAIEPTLIERARQ